MIGLFDISYRCAVAAEAAGKPDLPVDFLDLVDASRQRRRATFLSTVGQEFPVAKMK
ncbi:hypothetical protein WME76_47905 (plasmid) [Sorangium sp. So ce119]|uniref:hypothetical protein n=1 Tax=Sorangium sp. So ce119 TaxID=3133279 RepID=UPI003F60CCD0